MHLERRIDVPATFPARRGRVLEHWFVALYILGLSICTRAPVRAQDEFSSPVRVGTISDARIQELSGMVPVTGQENHFWIHNDSENSALLFVVRQDGQVIAEVEIPGSLLGDWEDIAKGPGPLQFQHFLYIADTGNNALDRDDLKIYRILEPQLPHLGVGQQLTSSPAESIPFRYPDGNFNAEALVVDPASSDIYIITKVAGSPTVYRLPSSQPGGEEQILIRLGDLPASALLTAADVSEDGRRLLVRTYEQVLLRVLPEGQPFDRIFFQSPVVLPHAVSESKSESICYDHSGRDYLTTNEGNPAPIHRAYLMVGHDFCTLEPDGSSPHAFTRGDTILEADGGPDAVNITDVVGIVDFLEGRRPSSCQDRGDVDDDGELTPDDATTLLGLLARGVAVKEPFREPGFDPTTDDLGCGEETPTILLAEDAIWRYRYDARPPPDDWHESVLATMLWPEGPGGIGFGVDGLGTRLTGIPDRTHTLYGSTVFSVPEDRLGDSYILEVDYNDGFVAYLNGVEVGRDHLGQPGFIVPGEMPAAFHGGGEFRDLHLCTEPLRTGDNVLAIEVHNRSLTDRTLYFRARLRTSPATDTPSPEPPSPSDSAVFRLEPDRLPNVGDRGYLRLLVECDEPIHGLSFELRFDNAVLIITGVSAADAFREQVWESRSLSSLLGMVAYAMVLQPDVLPDGIPPGESIHIVDIEYSTVGIGSGETTIFFDQRLARSLMLGHVIVGPRPSTISPRVEDLVTPITNTRLPVIEEVHDNVGRAGRTFFVVGVRFDQPGLLVRVCDSLAESELLADRQTIQVLAPECGRTGPVAVEVCTDHGCDRLEEGFRYLIGDEWIRADINADTLVDISDPIALLGHLFLGQTVTPACARALDANDDDETDVSDSIFILTFLFQGGEIIPPPYPDPVPCF